MWIKKIANRLLRIKLSLNKHWCNKLSALSIILGLSACTLDQSKRDEAVEVLSQSHSSETFTIQVLGINDFHGQVLSVDGEGGMFDLSRHLLHTIESTNEHSFVLHGGDHVGASPAESALLQDEPSIDLLNIIQGHCQRFRKNTCQVMGTTGNHEFDEGSDEMLRLLQGGNHKKGPFIHEHWLGANYDTLSANVVDAKSQKRLLKPYVTSVVNGVEIGFIGIALDTTPELVIPGIVDNLVFLNQAETVTKVTEELQAKGIETIIVIVHDGTEEQSYEGQTKLEQTLPLDSQFGQFLQALPDAIDLVVSGHSHEFTNAYVNNSHGKSILVTQAFDKGRAYADISLTINKQSKDVIKASAEVKRVTSEHVLPVSEQAQASLQAVKDIVSRSSEFALQYTQKRINEYLPSSSEIPLGQFIADSHKFALNTELAVMNDGGVRADLNAGEITWGKVFAIQPFGNSLVVKSLTGKQLVALMQDPEHYWSTGSHINDLGQLVINDKVVALDKEYLVGGNAYIMNSGEFAKGKLIRIEGLDIDATVDYIERMPSPFNFQDKPKPNA